jgi:hypothetical protein
MFAQFLVRNGGEEVTRGSVVAEAICYKLEDLVFETKWEELFLFFSIYRILLAALGPGIYSASNRN